MAPSSIFHANGCFSRQPWLTRVPAEGTPDPILPVRARPDHAISWRILSSGTHSCIFEDEYQNVILPIIVIRRLECVLIDWRETKAAEVLAKRPKLTGKELAKLVKELELNPKQCPFSNKTDWPMTWPRRNTSPP